MSKRKPRNANRGSLQAIEDQFSDLDCATQERVLETLQSLHRWSVRERSRKPATGDAAEAAGRADHARVVGTPWDAAAWAHARDVDRKIEEAHATQAALARVVGPQELLVDVQPRIDGEYTEEKKQ